MLIDEVVKFVDEAKPCTRKQVIHNFPGHSEATIYRHLAKLVSTGKIFNLNNGLITTKEPGPEKPDWPMHPILSGKQHDAFQLPLLSEYVVDPVRFRRIIDPIVEEFNQELVLMLVNIQIILAASMGVDLSDHYPDIMPADREQLQLTVAKIKRALGAYGEND